MEVAVEGPVTWPFLARWRGVRMIEEKLWQGACIPVENSVGYGHKARQRSHKINCFDVRLESLLGMEHHQRRAPC